MLLVLILQGALYFQSYCCFSQFTCRRAVPSSTHATFSLKMHFRSRHSSLRKCVPSCALTYTYTQPFLPFLSKLQFWRLYARVSVSVPVCATKGCALACCVLMRVHVLYELLKDRTGGAACFRPHYVVMQLLTGTLWKTALNGVCRGDGKWSLLRLHNHNHMMII